MGDKPCRFTRVGGNLVLKVFPHFRSLVYNWLRSMHRPLSTTKASILPEQRNNRRQGARSAERGIY